MRSGAEAELANRRSMTFLYVGQRFSRSNTVGLQEPNLLLPLGFKLQN